MFDLWSFIYSPRILGFKFSLLWCKWLWQLATELQFSFCQEKELFNAAGQDMRVWGQSPVYWDHQLKPSYSIQAKSIQAFNFTEGTIFDVL